MDNLVPRLLKRTSKIVAPLALLAGAGSCSPKNTVNPARPVDRVEVCATSKAVQQCLDSADRMDEAFYSDPAKFKHCDEFKENVGRYVRCGEEAMQDQARRVDGPCYKAMDDCVGAPVPGSVIRDMRSQRANARKGL